MISSVRKIVMEKNIEVQPTSTKKIWARLIEGNDTENLSH